jgi:hypothetical protein
MGPMDVHGLWFAPFDSGLCVREGSVCGGGRLLAVLRAGDGVARIRIQSWDVAWVGKWPNGSYSAPAAHRWTCVSRPHHPVNRCMACARGLHRFFTLWLGQPMPSVDLVLRGWGRAHYAVSIYCDLLCCPPPSSSPHREEINSLQRKGCSCRALCRPPRCVKSASVRPTWRSTKTWQGTPAGCCLVVRTCC